MFSGFCLYFCFFLLHNRRLFPPVTIVVSDLLWTRKYDITLRLAQVDNNIYNYNSKYQKWEATSTSRMPHNEDKMKFLHPDSPATGEAWMRKAVSFQTVKLTNDPHNKDKAAVSEPQHYVQFSLLFHSLLFILFLAPSL